MANYSYTLSIFFQQANIFFYIFVKKHPKQQIKSKCHNKNPYKYIEIKTLISKPLIKHQNTNKTAEKYA